MKIILGQGNPGKEYENTRHNIGFMILDEFAKNHNLTWQNKPKWKAEITEFNYGNEKIILVKPTCFYNLTGETLRMIGNFYNVDFKNDVLIIHDDLDLDFGVIRTRTEGSDAGNNGLKSIIANIGKEFKRVKIGTKNPKKELINSANFVLSKFNAEESANLPKIKEIVIQFINNFLEDNFENTKKSVF